MAYLSPFSKSELVGTISDLLFRLFASFDSITDDFNENYGNYIEAASLGSYVCLVFTMALRIVRSFLATAQMA